MTAPGPQPRHPCQRGNLVLVLLRRTTMQRWPPEGSLFAVCALRLHEGKSQAHPFLRILGVFRVNPARLIHTKPGEVPKSTADALVGLEIQPDRPVHEPWVTDHVRVPEQLPDHDPAVMSHDSVQLGQGLILHGYLPKHRDEDGAVEVIVRVRQHSSVHRRWLALLGEPGAWSRRASWVACRRLREPRWDRAPGPPRPCSSRFPDRLPRGARPVRGPGSRAGARS